MAFLYLLGKHACVYVKSEDGVVLCVTFMFGVCVAVICANQLSRCVYA